MNASHSVTSFTSITTSDTGTTSTQKARSFTSFTVAGHLHINACCDSADLDDVVTALVLAAAGLPASVLEPVGWVRSRSAPVALLATDESQGLVRGIVWGCGRSRAGRRAFQSGSCELGLGRGRSVWDPDGAICVADVAAGGCRRCRDGLGCWWARVTDVAKRRRQEL
jgi:hypothetical protein